MDPSAWRPRGGMRFVLLALALALALVLGVVGGARAMTDGAGAPPTIASDQGDYGPGSTVTLTGAYWQPGESIHVFVNDDAGKTWSHTADVTAAADGTITDQFQLPDWFVAFYSVTATGPASGTAASSFTDAANPSVTIGTASRTVLGASDTSDIPWSADQTGTYSVRIGSSCTGGTQLASGNYTTPGTVTTTVAATPRARFRSCRRTASTRTSAGRTSSSGGS